MTRVKVILFLNGVLEIQKNPGKKYQIIKERIASLIEIYLEFLELDFTPTGSVTLENEFEKVKKEGDESYELGAKVRSPILYGTLMECNAPYL